MQNLLDCRFWIIQSERNPSIEMLQIDEMEKLRLEAPSPRPCCEEIGRS